MKKILLVGMIMIGALSFNSCSKHCKEIHDSQEASLDIKYSNDTNNINYKNEMKEIDEEYENCKH